MKYFEAVLSVRKNKCVVIKIRDKRKSEKGTPLKIDGSIDVPRLIFLDTFFQYFSRQNCRNECMSISGTGYNRCDQADRFMQCLYNMIDSKVGPLYQLILTT